jgi:uncharacterized membrane protein YjjP (DUF1212 family)
MDRFNSVSRELCGDKMTLEQAAEEIKRIKKQELYKLLLAIYTIYPTALKFVLYSKFSRVIGLYCVLTITASLHRYNDMGLLVRISKIVICPFCHAVSTTGASVSLPAL